ncbi:MAG: MFS transporter [Candidatus Woesebacteria bacterium]|nr:MFS transporter [Candidatus Woesebacteria bacterium]
MLQEFKPVLKNRNFVYLWTSQITSQLTINIMNFVFLIWLFGKTGSAISTSFLWVAYSLPAILVGPFASATVDLVDRRKILIGTNLLQSLTIFLFALTHQGNIFLLFEVVFIYSLLNQFYVPAESASLPSLLPKDRLPQGNSLFLLTQQGSLVLGFGVAGFILALLGFEDTLLLCSFLLFVAFLSTLFLPKLTTGNDVPRTFELAVTGFFDKIVEGYKFIKGERKVLAPFLLLIIFQVLVQVATVAVPSIARDLLRLSLNTAGIFILVPAGIGAILGILVLPRLIAKGWRKKRVIDNSLLLVGLFVFIFTFIIPLLPYVLRVVSTFVSFVILGISFVGVTIPSQTLLQESTPKELRGRVFGNYWFLVTVASVLPVIFSGSIIEVLGIRILLLIFSLLGISGFLLSRRFGDNFLNNGTT